MKRNDYNYESFYYTSDSCLILMNEVRYKKNDFTYVLHKLYHSDSVL